VAEQAVERIIMPLSLPEDGTSADSLSGKPCLLKCALLRNVCDLGLGFNSVHLRMQEQVTCQLPLRFCAVTVTTGFWREADADHPARGLEATFYLGPGHESDRVIPACRHQHPAILAEQAVFIPPASQPARVLPAMPSVFPDSLGISEQALQQLQVIFGHRAEYHLIVHDTEHYVLLAVRLPGGRVCSTAVQQPPPIPTDRQQREPASRPGTTSFATGLPRICKKRVTWSGRSALGTQVSNNDGRPAGARAGEQTLLARLARRRPGLFAGRVICFARNFPGYELITAILDAGGDVVARVKAGISLPTAEGGGWLPTDPA
jgi:hypothetical protein